MKRITSILSLVIVLAMAFSMTAFAAADANEFTITTDKTSYVEGDTVYVTVELSGDLKEVAMVSLGVKYDTEKFSVSTKTDRTNGYACYDATWYAPLKNYEGLGYINTPSCGENPTGQVNMIYLSTDGYYIDDASDLYSDDATTTAAKLKFTALANIDKIDASCFELVAAACGVDKENGAHNAITLNQIAGEEESHEVASAERVAVTANATYQIGTGVGMKVTAPEGIAFSKMIWVIANGSERLYAKNIVELPNLSGDFKVAATFVNGAHNDIYKEATPVKSLTIGENDFDAIFFGVDADGNYVTDYFTNEAADKKAE